MVSNYSIQDPENLKPVKWEELQVGDYFVDLSGVNLYLKAGRNMYTPVGTSFLYHMVNFAGNTLARVKMITVWVAR
jgi:hypothetical protein